MFVKTYAPGKSIVTFLGRILSGFGDEIVTVKRAEDVFKKEVGADGEVSRRQSADRSGEIQITCKMTSDTNHKLEAILRLDELVGQQIGPALIADNLGNEEFTGQAWIRGWPEVKLGKDITDRVWTLDCSKLDMVFSPLPTNVYKYERPKWK